MSVPIGVADVTAALGRPPSGPLPPGDRFDGVTIDSRRAAPGELFVALRGERLDGHDFLAAAVEAGVTGAIGEDRPFEGRERIAYWVAPDGREALQSLAARHRSRLATRVVAITGSNGKTTTKELVAAVLSQGYRTVATVGNLNNQIGTPLTVLRIAPDREWAVVEVGTNRPGEIGRLAGIVRPDVAIVTNVAASHLEGLGSIEAVLEEKLALARALPPDGLLVTCGDDSRLARGVAGLPWRRIAYGLGSGNDVKPDRWWLDDEGRGAFELDGRTYRLRLVGRHNVVNALAAVAVGLEAGLSPGAIAGGLAEPEPLPMRMQVERWGEVVALVDCYNANPESVLAAAGTVGLVGGVRRGIAVLGEMLELGPDGPALHARLGRELADLGSLDWVVTVGPGAAPIADGAAAAGLAAERCETPEAAVRWLVDRIEPGDGILFKASRGAALETVVTRVREACLGCSVEVEP